jgi:hypothetical protein
LADTDVLGLVRAHSTESADRVQHLRMVCNSPGRPGGRHDPFVTGAGLVRPAGLDAVLTALYGDGQQLPP